MSEKRPAAFEDELMEQLAGLPEYDMDAVQVARMRRMARAHLPSPEPATRSWVERLGTLYTRALEPAWVTGVAALSLMWAVRAVLTIGL